MSSGGAKERIVTSIESVPGYFYDAIVYYSSYVVLISLIALLYVDAHKLVEFLRTLSVGEQLLALLSFLSFGYVWGQFSSALSYPLVKLPITKIVKRFHPKTEGDFLFSFDEILLLIDTKDTLKEKRHRNYWTILYFVQAIDPWTGSDLLKRYARCKLARVNAFNFMALVVLGISLRIFAIQLHFLSWPQYFFLCSLFVVLFSLEFYQRQKWFGDIVIKSLVAVLAARELTSSHTS